MQEAWKIFAYMWIRYDHYLPTIFPTYLVLQGGKPGGVASA